MLAIVDKSEAGNTVDNGEDIEESPLTDEAAINEEAPPVLPDALPQDERYFLLLATALQKCKDYRPKFGQGRSAGISVEEFAALYGADPFYHWLGLDSPLMYAAHKTAGGMTSIYRQIGIGSQWILFQMLQDCFGLTAVQAGWSYTVDVSQGRQRTLALDGRIDLAHISDAEARRRVEDWMREAANTLGLPEETLINLKGVVFEARQGYKSKDSKRQNADIANAAKAYAHLYLPVLLLFSTQIDADVAHRYQENMWLLLIGTIAGSSTVSAYTFCRDVVGYDLAGFFERFSSRIKTEVESVLQTLLSV